MSSEIEQSRTPTLEEVLQTVISKTLENMFVAMPGIVVKYDSVKMVADIRPAFKKPFVNEDGSEFSDELPVLPQVPVLFARSSEYFLHMPLKANDNVLLVFCDHSLDEYWDSNGNVQSDPINLRMHDISDAVAIPGFFTSLNTISDDISSGMSLGKIKGAQVRVKDSDVEVTSNGLSSAIGGYVAMSQLVDFLWTTLDTVFRTSWIPVAQDGGAALKAAYLAAFPTPPQSVASKNLKAD